MDRPHLRTPLDGPVEAVVREWLPSNHAMQQFPNGLVAVNQRIPLFHPRTRFLLGTANAHSMSHQVPAVQMGDLLEGSYGGGRAHERVLRPRNA